LTKPHREKRKEKNSKKYCYARACKSLKLIHFEFLKSDFFTGQLTVTLQFGDQLDSMFSKERKKKIKFPLACTKSSLATGVNFKTRILDFSSDGLLDPLAAIVGLIILF
jgi:hypothetical protein